MTKLIRRVLLGVLVAFLAHVEGVNPQPFL